MRYADRCGILGATHIKRILLLAILLLAVLVSAFGCADTGNSAKEKPVKQYYDNLINERYEANADILYLHERHLDVPTTQDQAAKRKYLRKIAKLRESNYKVLGVGKMALDQDDGVMRVRIVIKVQYNGKTQTYAESLQLRSDGRLIVDYSEDPSRGYRDGVLRPWKLARSPEEAIEQTLRNGVEGTLESSQNVRIKKHPSEELVYVSAGDFKYAGKKGFVHKIYAHTMDEGIGGWVVTSTREIRHD